MGGYEDLTERYRNGGAELIFGKPNISVAEGKTVGGGSEVNSGIYHPLSEKLVDEWIKEHGVRYFNELTNMAILSEEVGEVAKIIARKYGEQSLKENDNIDDLGDELSDVLFVLICLANQTGIDLEKSFKNNLSKKTERDKHRHKSNNKLK